MALGVQVGVRVGVQLTLAVGVQVGVRVGVQVGVRVGVQVGVRVGVQVGVGVAEPAGQLTVMVLLLLVTESTAGSMAMLAVFVRLARQLLTEAVMVQPPELPAVTVFICMLTTWPLAVPPQVLET